MDEYEIERVRDVIERARPALARAQGTAEFLTRNPAALDQIQRTSDFLARNAAALDDALRAAASFGDARAVRNDALRAAASFRDAQAVRDDALQTFASFGDGRVALDVALRVATFDAHWITQQVWDALDALNAAIADLQLSPEWEQLLDDLSAADDGETAIKGDLDGSVMALAAQLAVPALIDRIKVLSAEWSEPSLDDAAWRLERKDILWRTTDDEREFPIVIHGAVSVLEEVARQIARSPDKNLRQALRVLLDKGTITKSQQQRMLQVWKPRHTAAHGTPRAPKEVAGFVLLRVRRGLLDLLNAVDAQEQRYA